MMWWLLDLEMLGFWFCGLGLLLLFCALRCGCCLLRNYYCTRWFVFAAAVGCFGGFIIWLYLLLGGLCTLIVL